MTKEILASVAKSNQRLLCPFDARKNPAAAVMRLPNIIPGLVREKYDLIFEIVEVIELSL